MQFQRQTAADSQTKPVRAATVHTAFVIIITQPESWYSFYRPKERGRVDNDSRWNFRSRLRPWRSSCVFSRLFHYSLIVFIFVDEKNTAVAVL